MKSIVRRAPVPVWRGILEHIWKFFGYNFGVGPYVPEPRLEANYEVKKYRNRDFSLAMDSGANAAPTIDFNTYNVIGELSSKIYIYNVSTVQHDVSGTFIKNGKILPKRPEDFQYRLFTSIPEILRVPKYYADSNEVGFFIEDGKRVAMDLINPDNLGLDQDKVYTCGDHVTAYGRNLGERGVFWSLNNPPTQDEINSAKARMDKHYKYVITMIDTLEFVFRNTEWTKDTAQQQRIAKVQFEEAITPEAHAVADHFGIERSWHKPLSVDVKQLKQDHGI